jgi:hypothetical protein
MRGKKTIMIAAITWKPHLPPWYVADLPGHNGTRRIKAGPERNSDWGYTDRRERAIDLSPYWMRRFSADSKRCGRTARFYEMSVVYAFDSQGGFIAGDKGTGHIAYAYPNSDNADLARSLPEHVAAVMIRAEKRLISTYAGDRDRRAHLWEAMDKRIEHHWDVAFNSAIYKQNKNLGV